MNARELYRKCSDLVGSGYPSGTCPIPEPAPIAGKGFFPVVSGSFHSGSLATEVHRKWMFVGQDWGSLNNFKALRESSDRDLDIKSGTGETLLELLTKVEISLEDCFFTNALFGLRTSGKNTGRSPGWKDKTFRERCEAALRLQIKEIKPSVIICLGRDAPHLVFKIIDECSRWKSAKNYTVIDEGEITGDKEGGLIHPVSSEEEGIIAAAILVHPSYRRVNVKRRKFRDQLGCAAEFAILKSVKELVNQIMESSDHKRCSI